MNSPITRDELKAFFEPRVTALLERIAKAFVNIPRPFITLTVAETIDDQWGMLTPECHRLSTAMDPEQTWMEVADERMRTNFGYFTFADAEGWQFYLPAYMAYDLRNFPSYPTDVYHACVGRYWKKRAAWSF